MPTLIIDSVAVAIETLGKFSQRYQRLDVVDLQRTAANTGILRSLSTATGKLATQITCQAWAPGHQDLDPTTSHTVHCVTPRTINATSLSIDIPATRRNDALHAPIAFAAVDNRLVPAVINNLAAINAYSTDTATLTAVSGAVAYRVVYWPKLVCAIVRNEASGNAQARFSWTFEAEEL